MFRMLTPPIKRSTYNWFKT